MKESFKYMYLISFAHRGGFGSIIIKRNTKIDSEEKYIELGDFVNTKVESSLTSPQQVVILNIILLK